MKGSEDGPSIAVMAQDIEHYQADSKRFSGIRQDLNRLIRIDEYQSTQLDELNQLLRKVIWLLDVNCGGRR